MRFCWPYCEPWLRECSLLWDFCPDWLWPRRRC